MGKSKITFFGETLIDLTGDTATPEDVAQGKTFHLPNGEQATGTNTGGGGGAEECYMHVGDETAPDVATGDLLLDISGDVGGGLELPETITAGNTPILFNGAVKNASGSNLSNTGISITVPLAGTYRFKWTMAGGDPDEDAIKSRLYKNGTAVGTQKSTTGSLACSEDLACAAGDTVTLYFGGYEYWSSYYGGVGGLCACINWNNGFTGG